MQGFRAHSAAMSDRPPHWLGARLLGLLVLGWAGMFVLAGAARLIAPSSIDDPAVIEIQEVYALDSFFTAWDW